MLAKWPGAVCRRWGLAEAKERLIIGAFPRGGCFVELWRRRKGYMVNIFTTIQSIGRTTQVRVCGNVTCS